MSTQPSPSSGERMGSLGAEAALAAVSVATVAGMVRLFVRPSTVVPALVAVVGAHVLAGICRRRSWSAPVAALAGGGVLVLVLAWTVAPATLAFGLPTPTTLGQLAQEVANAWRQFGEVRAPAEPTAGFVAGIVVGGWVAAWSADTFAFRLRARFEAVAPTFTLFMFTTVLAGPEHRVAAAGAYLAAVMTFALVSEGQRRRRPIWVNGSPGAGPRSVLLRGTAMAGVAVVAAVMVGPHLPGTANTGLLDQARDAAAGSRVTVSPLVDIRARLVDQSAVELFQVRSESPSYWRLTSLEAFDGTIWSSTGRYREAGGNLPGPQSGRVDELATHRFRIGPLATIWLPSAFRPVEVSGPGGIRFDPDSASLLSPEDTAQGLEYEVTTATVDVDAPRSGDGPRLDGEVRSRYLDLPDTLNPQVADVATAIAGGAGDAYQKALAIQEWFRSEFTYDLSIPPGHGTDAIDTFLANRRGYCEQFAGTFAAMARSLGIPARVAVGFVAGDRQDDGTYVVAGRDAHAWPEVFVDGVGWLAFEPTPGRQVPGVADHTGVQPSEADAGAGSSDPAPGVTTPEAAAEGEDFSADGSGGGVASTDLEPVPSPGSALGRIAVAVALTLGLYLAVLNGLRRASRHARRRRATGGSESALVAWREAEEAMARAGAPRRAFETPEEFARRCADRAAGRPLAELAVVGTRAGYAAEDLEPHDVAQAWRWSAEVGLLARGEEGRWNRVVRLADPRPNHRWPPTEPVSRANQ